MKTYILLLRNNSEGAYRMLASGSAGAADQASTVERLGGRVVTQWAVTGRFDAVLVAQLPNDAAAAAMTLGATAAGQYAELLSAIEPDAMDEARNLYAQAIEALAKEIPQAAEPTTGAPTQPRDPADA